MSARLRIVAAERPERWAQPLDLDGVPNLHRIGLSLYRSAQPTQPGMMKLREQGIRTILSFRAYHDDDKLAHGTGIRLLTIPIHTWDIRDEHVVSALRIMRTADMHPLLIHCQHGADRTGLMSAMYRIVYEGWSKQQAVEEMTQGGYGYHTIWNNLLEYIDKVDVKSLRDRLSDTQTAPD